MSGSNNRYLKPLWTLPAGGRGIFNTARQKLWPTRRFYDQRNPGTLELPKLRAPTGISAKRRTVMRKHSSMLLAAATIGLAASQASAADLPTRTPAYVPPAPPQVTWTGC